MPLKDTGPVLVPVTDRVWLPIKYFALFLLLIEANNEVLLHGTNNTSHLETLTVSLCVVLIGSSPNLKFLEDEGRDLGIIPEETISRNNLIDIGKLVNMLWKIGIISCQLLAGFFFFGDKKNDTIILNLIYFCRFI